MKRNMIITLIVGALIALGSIGSVFAAEATETTTNQDFTRGNGLRLYSTANSVEELLQEKLELIDQMVEDGKLTKEAGENYKAIITERMEDCETIGANRSTNDRLGIGFGRGMGLGNRQGRGCGFGFGNASYNN